MYQDIDMKTLRERLISEREAQGLTQDQLAHKAVCKQSNIGSLESGQQKSSKHIPAIADALGINALWLAEGRGPKYPDGNTMPGPSLRGRVPLISWVQAGAWSEVIDNLQPGEGERIETTYRASANAYALRVRGDSMEPKFPSGCLLIVEPNENPEPGKTESRKVSRKPPRQEPAPAGFLLPAHGHPAAGWFYFTRKYQNPVDML